LSRTSAPRIKTGSEGPRQEKIANLARLAPRVLQQLSIRHTDGCTNQSWTCPRDSKSHRIIAMIIPEFVEAHWYEYLLHNMCAARLKALIDQKGDERTFVTIGTAWYLYNV
jgi:hypothetical protein